MFQLIFVSVAQHEFEDLLIKLLEILHNCVSQPVGLAPFLVGQTIFSHFVQNPNCIHKYHTFYKIPACYRLLHATLTRSFCSVTINILNES